MRCVKGMSVAVAVVFGAVALGAPTTQPGPQPREVHLNVRPAAPPRPALRYRLLPTAVEQAPGNAATLYYTALLLQPHGEGSRGDLFRAIARLADDVPLAELKLAEATAALGRLNSSYLRYADMAALREHCDWGIPFREEGIATLLPHLSEIRGLSRALSLDIRVSILKGDYAAAVKRLRTGYAMTRHLNSEPVLIEMLVGAAVAQSMSRRIEEMIGSPGAPNLYWALADLPRPIVNLRRAMQNERGFLEYSFPQLRLENLPNLTAEQFRAMVRQMSSAGMSANAADNGPDLTDVKMALWLAASLPRAKRFLVEHEGLPAAEVDAMPLHQAIARYLVGDYRYWSDEMHKWFALPYWQASEGLDRAERALQSAKAVGDASHLTLLLLPAVRSAYTRAALIDRQVASLQCIEALRAYAAAHDGKLPVSLDELKDTPAPLDPLTGKPFIYELKGQTAVLDASMPPRESPQRGWRYIITISR